MTTTAQYRKAAQQAESDLEWELAVFFWKQALKVYPPISGELAQADRERMITAINADIQMFAHEVP
jgi:hypothetical protein